jgi:4-hydroxybenzoate polyprenyltransferase
MNTENPQLDGPGSDGDAAAPSVGDDPLKPAPSLFNYLKLCRIPNVFTAFADVAMGYLFVNHGVAHWESLLALLAASGCLYCAGMVLNDVYDVEADLKERPERPIPSGAISFEQARAFGYGLLVTGVFCSLIAGWVAPSSLPYRSGVIGVALAVSIVLYDALLKKTIVAPWLMGTCRLLNVLLGMSLIEATPAATMATLAYEPHQLVTAAGMGLYVAGITWFARTEAQTSDRLLLGFGAAVMVVGLGLLTIVPDCIPIESTQQFHLPLTTWPLVVIVLMVVTMRRCILAISNPRPYRVQAAIKQCILSIIVLDAALVLLTNPFGYALAVCALLAPMLVLGQWIRST